MRKSRERSTRATGAILLALATLALGAPAAFGERVQDGDLLASFDADLTPSSLPRTEPAPVSVQVAGDFWNAAGDPGLLPQLRSITIAINRQGRLFDRGLPVCLAEQIQPATERDARQICRDAIVGSGHVRLQVRIPGQLPFLLRARVLAFNGPYRGGQKLILAQVYARKPPGAFVLVFRVRRESGLFGTVLTTTLPAAAREWAYLTHFDLNLRRTYEQGGRHRSYISAACGAPAGFRSVLFPFARASYAFANGQRLRVGIARTCHVAGE